MDALCRAIDKLKHNYCWLLAKNYTTIFFDFLKGFFFLYIFDVTSVGDIKCKDYDTGGDGYLTTCYLT